MSVMRWRNLFKTYNLPKVPQEKIKCMGGLIKMKEIESVV